MGKKCKKCACEKFKWNPVSCVEKLFDDIRNNDRTDRAYRNCICGHHYNCHS